VASLVTPVVAAISLATSWPPAGWSGSPIEIYLGWTLLSLPYVMILGSPPLAAVLAAVRIDRPSRRIAIAMAVVLGDGLFAVILTQPWQLDRGVVAVAETALIYLPLWLVYGAILRLPSARAQVTLAHAD
jgi:hypothetical protein